MAQVPSRDNEYTWFRIGEHTYHADFRYGDTPVSATVTFRYDRAAVDAAVRLFDEYQAERRSKLSWKFQ